MPEGKEGILPFKTFDVLQRVLHEYFLKTFPTAATQMTVKSSDDSIDDNNEWEREGNFFTGESPFQQIDDLYISIFYLLKNSGKIKSEIKEAANALQIQHYTSSKCIPAIIRHMASGNCGI